MNLGTLLTESQIVPEMEAAERWPAIVELVDHLCARQLLPADRREGVLALLQEREDQVTTGIGSGVAIPHAFSDKVPRVLAAFGRSRKGIDFEAIDNAPVHYIVLLIVPKEEHQQHLRTLAAIAKMFSLADTRNRLDRANTAGEILAAIDGRTGA